MPLFAVGSGKKPCKTAIHQKLRNVENALEPNVFRVKRKLPFLFA